jgi:hypothetical protein
VRHYCKDAPAAAKVAVREVAVTTGIPTVGGGRLACSEFIYPGEKENLPAGLSRRAGYGNNTGLSGPRSEAWQS